MTKRDKSSIYVTKDDCVKTSGRISEELKIVKKALVGDDMRGGLVAEVGLLRSDMKTVKDSINNQKTKGRDWRLLGFTLLSSVIGGVTVAVILNVILKFI